MGHNSWRVLACLVSEPGLVKHKYFKSTRRWNVSGFIMKRKLNHKTEKFSLAFYDSMT